MQKQTIMHDKNDFFKSIIGSIIKSDSKIEEFSSQFAIKKYEKKSHFLQEFDENSRIGFLKDGFMRSYIVDREGNEATIRFIKPMEIISGGFAFNSPSPVSIQAIDRSTVYETSWMSFSRYISHNKELLMVLNQFLSYGSFRTTKLLSDFIRLDAKQRYLLFNIEFPGIIEKIPHYYIANYLGISTVQLSRIRKKLTLLTNVNDSHDLLK